MKLWIVGQVFEGGIEWEFQGVFDDFAKAEAACRDGSYFICTATLNESLPHESVPWPCVRPPIMAGRLK